MKLGLKNSVESEWFIDLVSDRSEVRIPSGVPTKVAEKDATPEALAAARVSAVSEDKIEHQTRWRCKRPFS